MDTAKTTPLLAAILSLIGFTAVIVQIVLMRELIVVFYGNEISLGLMLANWLFWTAIGSSLLGRLARRVQHPRRLMAGLQALISLAFPLTVLAVRASRGVFHPVAGEILGPGPMFLTSLATLSVFCVISGWLFAAGTRLYADETGASIAAGTGTVYLLEAAGSGLGGVLASLVLIRYLSSFEIASTLALLNLLAAVALTVRRLAFRRALMAGLLGLFLLLVYPYAGAWLEKSSLSYLWKGFHLVATRNSVYGNLAVVDTEGSRSLYENGLVVFTTPDPAAAEEAVHYALLEHPSPRSLVLIGGGVGGGLAQALLHPSLQRADYVELDPAILTVADEYFQTQWAPMLADPRVRIHNSDGRLFLKTTASRFDVVVVNLPDPQTAQLNRFYTREFFEEAARKLTAGGLLSFQVTGAENYISPELAEFLRCLNKTLREVFAEVVAIPGSTIHFFAATQPGILTAEPEVLTARLRARGLQTRYVREYYIPFRMMPDRMLDLQEQMEIQPDTPVNRDFAPIAYYFDVALWSSRFHQGYRRVFDFIARIKFHWVTGGAALLLFATAALLGWRLKRRARLRASAGLCVAAMGFTLIGLEILLLLGFQAIYGYVYHQLAILIAAFMVGMALGSWWGLRRCVRVGPRHISAAGTRGGMLTLAGLQLVAAASALLLYALFESFVRIEHSWGLFIVSQILFPGLALLSGMLGGYQFPVANRIYFRDTGDEGGSPGALYGLDLLGAALGAVVLSAYLFPVFGFLRTAFLIAVVNLAPAALAVGVSLWGETAMQNR